MAIVNHHRRIVLVGQVADFIQTGHIAIHRKNTIRGNQTQTGIFCFFEPGFEVSHITVFVAIALSLAQTDAIDNAGVIELVTDDGILGAKQRLKDTAVGVEAGAIKNRIFGAQKL